MWAWSAKPPLERRVDQRPTLAQGLGRPAQPPPHPPARQRHAELRAGQGTQPLGREADLRGHLRDRPSRCRDRVHRRHQPGIQRARRSREADVLLPQPVQLVGDGDARPAPVAQLVGERAVRLDEERQQLRPRAHPVRRHRGHEQRRTPVERPRGVDHRHRAPDGDGDLERGVPVQGHVDRRAAVGGVARPHGEAAPRIAAARHAADATPTPRCRRYARSTCIPAMSSCRRRAELPGERDADQAG